VGGLRCREPSLQGEPLDALGKNRPVPLHRAGRDRRRDRRRDCFFPTDVNVELQDRHCLNQRRPRLLWAVQFHSQTQKVQISPYQ
jgi:hypothetical protein